MPGRDRPDVRFERAGRPDVLRVYVMAPGRRRIHVGWVKRLTDQRVRHAGQVWRRFLAGQRVVVDRGQGALVLDRSDPRGIWIEGSREGELVGWVFLPRRPRGHWGRRGSLGRTREDAYLRWAR